MPDTAASAVNHTVVNPTGSTPDATRGAPAPRRHSRLLSFSENYALIALTILVFLFFSFYPASSAIFPTIPNVNVILGSQAVVALIALAALFPLICGYFDFSLGAVAATSSVLSAGLMTQAHAPLWLAIVLSVAVGALIGLVNGLLVTRFNMSPFVTTLGMATLLGGIIQWYTGGQTIPSGSQGLAQFGSATFAGIPVVVYVVVLIAAVAWYLLTHTPYGRSLYAIGSNASSAALVGLRVKKNVWLSFVLAGVVSGLAGVMQLARTGSATSDAGTSLLFPALAAVFLGATAITPGFFNVIGTIVGAVFVSVSVSGLVLSGASAWASPVFNGVALLAAVGLSTYLGRRRARS